jgi:hypothetical protein
MDPAAIEKAQQRLEKAAAYIKQIKAAKNYAEFQSAWTDFLIAMNTIYAALEQGSKAIPQSRQWFGTQKRERRKDPLLQYLHQARNADEHGIKPISALKPGKMELRAEGSVLIKRLAVTGGQVLLDAEPNPQGKLAVAVTPGAAVLVPVTDDRFGTSFDPPSEHLGKPLTDASPIAVAELGFAFHEALVAEATTLLGR